MSGVGAYLRTLREKQGISRAWVAEQARTSETSLYRIEMGKQAPATALLIGIVKAVRGSFDDIEVLLDGTGEPAALGEQLACSRLTAGTSPAVHEFSRADLDAIRSRLADDPGFMDLLTESIGRQILKRRF